jgi:hypothetical protein
LIFRRVRTLSSNFRILSDLVQIFRYVYNSRALRELYFSQASSLMCKSIAEHLSLRSQIVVKFSAIELCIEELA